MLVVLQSFTSAVDNSYFANKPINAISANQLSDKDIATKRRTKLNKKKEASSKLHCEVFWLKTTAPQQEEKSFQHFFNSSST